MSFSSSHIHKSRNKTDMFRHEWLISFLFPWGWGWERASLQTFRLFITCQHDSCSENRVLLDGFARMDDVPDPSSGSGTLQKHHQGQVLSCSRKDTSWGHCPLTLSCKPLPGNFSFCLPFSDHYMEYFTSFHWSPEGPVLQIGHTAWAPQCWGENASPMILPVTVLQGLASSEK